MKLPLPGYALPIYSFASFVDVFFSYGVPVLYARKTGTFQKEEADQCFGVGLTITSVIGVLMFMAILFGGDAFLKAYQPDLQVYASASAYLTWMKYAVLLLPLNVLARIGKILANSQIAIFAISTFNTDYILTKEECFENALSVLKNAGYKIKQTEETGENT